MPFGGWFGWPNSKKPCIRWGRYPPKRRGILGSSGRLKSVVNHCCGVRSKKSITASARLLLTTALLPTGQCHFNISPVKNLPYTMRPVVKILWPLVIIIIIIIFNTCVSVRLSDAENSARSAIERYCRSRNFLSSASSCCVVNGVRGFLFVLCLRSRHLCGVNRGGLPSPEHTISQYVWKEKYLKLYRHYINIHSFIRSFIFVE